MRVNLDHAISSAFTGKDSPLLCQTFVQVIFDHLDQWSPTRCSGSQIDGYLRVIELPDEQISFGDDVLLSQARAEESDTIGRPRHVRVMAQLDQPLRSLQQAGKGRTVASKTATNREYEEVT